jgi:hypothetical protein
MTQTIEPAVRDKGVTETTETTTSVDRPPRPSKAARVAGWIISGIIILWLGVLGTLYGLTNRAVVEESMGAYGYAPSTITPIQIVFVCCMVLYAIPRTAVLGAILLTGYLGGAVSTHVRAGDAWFFPVIVGVLVWLGLFLRDPRIRELAPLRKV